MSIQKSLGHTPTERLLAELGERSFLKLWSYPNPVKDDGKELCDLLAVFENHAFVFFDRESRHALDGGKDERITWGRWKRSVVDAQIRTATGAERYLRAGRKIYLDSELTVPFPISFDPRVCIIHKIIVAHGAKEACEKASVQNIYGSLGISYGIGDDLERPFVLDLSREAPPHVLDSHNLPILLGELDTFEDFRAYLDAKLDAIRTFKGLTYAGEEDLLAHYFLNYDPAHKKHRIGPREGNFDWVMIGEGEWKDFVASDAYRARKDADEISYFWDELIQRTCENALRGRMLGNSDLFRGKSAIHEMAKEPRFSRRALSQHIIEAIRGFPEKGAPFMRNVSFMPSYYSGTGYVFLQLKVPAGMRGESDHREKRQLMLEIACGAARNRFPDLQKLVGIAIDAPKFVRRNSEDFILMECDDWCDERRRHYEEANLVFKFFDASTMNRVERRVHEFPRG